MNWFQKLFYNAPQKAIGARDEYRDTSSEKFIWSTQSKEMLMHYDRFLGREMIYDLHNHWLDHRVSLGSNLNATGVSRNRYAIIWEQLPDGKMFVHSIACRQIDKTENPSQLFSHLDEIVQAQYNNKYKLLAERK